MPKVWIADDDEAIRIVLEEGLKSDGLEIKTFSDGQSLIDALNIDKPDLIISDIKMPGMHGYDLLKHIKNNYDKLPVIIMTAFTDMQAAIDSYGGGAFEYIPVGEDEKIVKVYGEAGDLFIFDADTIKHRATPPINNPRLALELMLLAQHEGMPNVVTSIPGTGWPVDPYRFKLSPHAIVQNNSKTWFPNYPKLILNNNVTQVAAE